jgi:uncharacterized membrane protein YphA (DoxX/SURF4 family)
VLIGRILFAAIFIASGFAHLSQSQAMAGYAQSKGVPAARPAVLVTGVMILAGGLMVLLGLWADLGALLIVAFLIPTAVMMHAFWKESDAGARQMEMIQFQKDIALGGGALLAFVLFAYFGNRIDLMITGPLFNLR